MRLWIFIFLLGTITSNINAAPIPTVATTTGSVRGASFTISGSGFGTKATAKPQIYADFEGSINPNPKGVKTAWNTIQNMVRVTTDTMFGDSLGMAKGSWSGCASGGARSFHLMTDLIPATTIILYVDTRQSQASSTNEKLGMRIWSAGTASPDWVFSSQSGGIALNECQTSYSSRFVGNIDIAANTWENEIAVWTHGGNNSGLTGNGQGKWVRSGSVRFDLTDVPNCSGDMGETWIGRFTDTADCQSDGTNFYMDNIYLDTTFSRVELSTATTYAGSKNLRPQVCTSWADGSLTCEITNMGNIPAGSQLYVYVTDAQNVTNANGLALSVLGSERRTTVNNIKLNGVSFR